MQKLFDRTLIISPHCDDETIGCGGLLSRIVKNNQEALIVEIAESHSYSNNVKRYVDNKDRMNELDNAIKVIKSYGNGIINSMQLKDETIKFIDGELDSVPKKKYVTMLDSLIEEFKPTAVLFPYKSHHQDHKLVHDVVISALRPTIDTNFIQLKAMYEYTYYDGWNPEKLTNKLYVELTESDLRIKMAALDCFKSQIRKDPRDLLDLSAIEDLARIRGREIGTYYAEAFYPLSIVYK